MFGTQLFTQWVDSCKFGCFEKVYSLYFDFLNFFAMIRTKSVETDRNSSRFPAILSDVKDLLRILHKWKSENRPSKIKIIMKNRFFKIALETFLGHLAGVGWSPACEKIRFSCFVTPQVPAEGVQCCLNIFVVTVLVQYCKLTMYYFSK